MTSQIKIAKLSKHFTTFKKEAGIKGSFKSLFKRDNKIIKAVDNLSFSISSGEMVGFVGPNGAGKTTTLKMLSGLLRPTSGSCQVLGFNPFNRSHQFLRQISLVMGQKSQLWPDLPAVETFELNREIYEIDHQDYQTTLSKLVAMLDVGEVIHQQPRKMSLGQRMKCELIASLIYHPKILFLDEPTLGLDVVMQKKLRQFIKDYNRQYGATVLLTSHYMDDVKEICRRLIIINHGHLIYDGTVSDLIKQHANYKTISVVFNQPVDKRKLSLIGKVADFEDLRASIIVPRRQVALRASKLLVDFEVDDLDIQEPRLENIIAEIFESNQ